MINDDIDNIHTFVLSSYLKTRIPLTREMELFKVNTRGKHKMTTPEKQILQVYERHHWIFIVLGSLAQ